jgi:hypothetical protein
MAAVPVIPDLFKLAIGDIDDDVPTLQFGQFPEIIKGLRSQYLHKLYQALQVRLLLLF